MRLGKETNTRSNEIEMQKLFEEYLIASYSTEIVFKREVSVNEVKRRADFLLLKGSRLINVELKTNPSSILINQLVDHSLYCDYCFALVPDFCVMQEWLVKDLVKHRFGLIVFNHNKKVFTEALPAMYNKGRDNNIKYKYLKLIQDNEPKR